jgi:DNA-binding response OmpR family regulator
MTQSTDFMRVLVITDDNDLRDEICEVVEASGQVPMAAANEDEAWDLFEFIEPTMVIIDAGCSCGNGEMLIQKMRDKRGVLPLYVLAVGDVTTQESEYLALRRQADDFLYNPFPFAELIMRLHLAQRTVQALQSRGNSRQTTMTEPAAERRLRFIETRQASVVVPRTAPGIAEYRSRTWECRIFSVANLSADHEYTDEDVQIRWLNWVIDSLKDSLGNDDIVEIYPEYCICVVLPALVMAQPVIAQVPAEPDCVRGFRWGMIGGGFQMNACDITGGNAWFSSRVVRKRPCGRIRA